MPDRETVLAALDAVIDPKTGQGLVAAGLVQGLVVADDRAGFAIEVAAADAALYAPVRDAAEAALKALEGMAKVAVVLTAETLKVSAPRRASLSPQAVDQGRPKAPVATARPAHVRRVLAVASGKGGVGKSTVAVNLAAAFSARGLSVGILDADVYGPSIPTMLGVSGAPEYVDNQITPHVAHGLKTMSVGLLTKANDAMIWRGPMATQAVEQLLRQTNWKDLDYLIVDMPPGTGDIQLTLSQRVPMTGAVIVTTPQDIALLDAKKGIKMFEKVGVPILGIVENMAVHICSQCGHTEHIFGADGGKKMAADYKMDYLGALPLDMQIRLHADSGRPTVVADPDGEVAGIYKAVARQVAITIAAKAKDFSAKFPTIKISKDT